MPARKKAPVPPALLRLKLVHSTIGGTERQRATVRSLGLRKLQQVVEQADNAVTRGMLAKVSHLVQVLDDGTKAEAEKA